MRRRANSGSKSRSDSRSDCRSDSHSRSYSKTTRTIEMTPSTPIYSSPPSPSSFTGKRRTHSQMERGSFGENSNSIDYNYDYDYDYNCDEDLPLNMICSSTSGSSSESGSESEGKTENENENEIGTTSIQDEAKHRQDQLNQRFSERQSLLHNAQDPSSSSSSSSSPLGTASFPNLSNLNMNLNMNNLNMTLGNLNLNLNNLNMNNLNMSMNNLNMNMEHIDFQNLPLEIQMALEDTLLGWTHLTSVTLGHVLLPLLTFHTVKRASKYVLERTVYILNAQFQSNDETETSGNAIEAVLISSTTHFLMGLVAGIAAFRVIRHRRRVWFKHAYGSKEYKQCEEGKRRREAVLRADNDPNSLLSLSSPSNDNNNTHPRSRRTWTRVFSNYKKKRHKKKVQRASERFERHHTGLSPKNSFGNSSNNSINKNNKNKNNKRAWTDEASVAPTEVDYDSLEEEEETNTSNSDQNRSDNNHRRSSIAHDAVSIPRIRNVPYAHGGFFGAAPFFLADRRWVTILRDLLPDVYVEISRRVGTSYYYSKLLGLRKSNAAGLDYTQDASKLIHWAENNPVVAAYGVAMDLQIKQEHLQIEKNYKTRAAGQQQKTSKKQNTAMSKPFLENGGAKRGSIIDQFYNQTINTDCNDTDAHNDAGEANSEDNEQTQDNDPSIDIPNLEWDIFVDPQLVRRVEAVLDAMNGYVASKIATKTTNNSRDKEFATTVSTKAAPPPSASDSDFASASARKGNGESKPSSSCENCVFCKNSTRTCKEKETGNSFDDEDSGKSEAKALLADHDHNMSNMNPMGVNINNLCSTSAVDLCTGCFPTNNGTLNGTISRNNTANILSIGDDDVSPKSHDRDEIVEDICLHHLANDPVLRYLERELEKRTQELTDRLLIAHGNVLQLITEQVGVLKDWNYSRVQRTRRTLGGGMYARQWMSVFAESLRLGMKSPRRKCNTKRKGNRPEREGRSVQKDDDVHASEMDALLPLANERQYGRGVDEHENKSFDEDDASSWDEEEDYEDFLEQDRYDPLEDENNHCTCSPRCCLDYTLAESVKLIERITQTKEPVGILLDLKSRHVPKRVLSLMVRSLQKAGIRVVGIASFEISDIRGVCSHPQDSFCESGGSTNFVGKIPMGIRAPLGKTKEILMVHSAGDLQAACDDGLVRPGDHVFFNGGSLILDSARSSTIKSLLGFFFDMCVCGYYTTFDPCVIEDGYRIQSYGYACSSMGAMDSAECFADEARNLVERSCGSPQRRKSSSITTTTTTRMDLHHSQYHKTIASKNSLRENDSTLLSPAPSSNKESEMGAVMKTLADYKKHYGFSMGLYLQEFSIDEAAARLLIDLVNDNPELYDLGLAWGGINGMTVHGIQPGRFTSTDGYWNQRRLGKRWKDPAF